jgi:hypothetical protein
MVRLVDAKKDGQEFGRRRFLRGMSLGLEARQLTVNLNSYKRVLSAIVFRPNPRHFADRFPL